MINLAKLDLNKRGDYESMLNWHFGFMVGAVSIMHVNTDNPIAKLLVRLVMILVLLQVRDKILQEFDDAHNS